MPQQFTVNTTVCHLPTVYIKDHFLTISTHCKRRIICLKSGAFKYLSTNTHMCILRHFNRQRRWSFYFFINCSSSFFYRSFIGLLIAVIALEWHENVAFPIPRMENRIMPSIDILFRNKVKFGAYIYFNTLFISAKLNLDNYTRFTLLILLPCKLLRMAREKKSYIFILASGPCHL